MWSGRRDGHFFMLHTFPELIYYQHMIVYMRCYRNAIEVVLQTNSHFHPAAKDKIKMGTN